MYSTLAWLKYEFTQNNKKNTLVTYYLNLEHMKLKKEVQLNLNDCLFFFDEVWQEFKVTCSILLNRKYVKLSEDSSVINKCTAGQVVFTYVSASLSSVWG